MAKALRAVVVGGGGREHALAWALAQSGDVGEVAVLPGNAGTVAEGKVKNVPIAVSDLDGIVRFAKDWRADILVPGPEAPLVAGLADRVAQVQLPTFVFGPSRKAAMVTEGSKIAATKFAKRHKIPIPESWCFNRADEAIRCLESERRPTETQPLVIKPDGLTGGKGVRIVRSLSEGVEAVNEAFALRHRGVVVQEHLDGFELTFTCVVAGRWVVALPISQDSKQLQGQMTGGMGAFSPVPVVDAGLVKHICDRIVVPTIEGLAAEGIPYCGVFYIGLMVVEGDPYVLEFNCRFGDPEAQAILARVGHGIVPLILAARDPELRRGLELFKRPETAFALVLAAAGYPGALDRVGDLIIGLGRAATRPGVKVFHSGTALGNDGEVLTAGGRVLTVTALGETLGEVREMVYAAARDISWPGMQYDPDIGLAALAEPAGR